MLQDVSLMRNPLQDQLLKAGLVKKAKVAQVVREQNQKRHGKQASTADHSVDARRLQAERAERDRLLAAERNSRAREAEMRAQIRQIVEAHAVPAEGEIDYRFTDGDAIRSVLVSPTLRAQLAAGTLVIARHDDGYRLLPREAADKVRARDASMVALDHGQPISDDSPGEDDAHYRQFEVPDDLIW